MKRRFVYFSLLTIGMVFLLYLMNETYYLVQQDSQTVNPSASLLISMSVLFFLFGIFTEWKALKKLIRAQIRVHWVLLIISLILIVITFIPSFYWVQWFGVSRTFYIGALWKPEIKAILTVFSGILFIRSLVEGE